jgi:hypothetical protein
MSAHSDCETDAECSLRDKALLEDLKAIPEVLDDASYHKAVEVIGSVRVVYGNTLRFGHVLFDEYDRVDDLIYNWEKTHHIVS